MRRRWFAWAGVVGLAIAGLQTPVVATAAPTLATGQHCAVELQPVSESGTAAAPTDFRCFDTFAESIAHATGGRIRLAPDASFVTKDQVEAATRSMDVSIASTLVGIEYGLSGFDGSSLSLYGSRGGCNDGYSYGFPNMGNYGWNQRISSARVYNGCVSTHYDYTYYGGGYIVCNPCSSMGGMNNDTSSIRFR